MKIETRDTFPLQASPYWFWLETIATKASILTGIAKKLTYRHLLL